MSEDQEKVVRLDGRPFEPPVEEPKKGEPDTRAIAALEAALEEATAGRAVGIALVMFDPETMVPITFAHPLPEEEIRASGVRLLGGLRILEEHVLCLAEFGDAPDPRDDEWDGEPQ